MKVKLLSLVFATLLGLNAQNANAIMGITGTGGLISIMAGAALTSTMDYTLTIIGVILLDENSNALEFTSVDLKDAAKLNVSEADVLIYNNELEELNIVLSEVNLELERIEAPTKVEAQELLDIYSEGLSHSTMRVVKSILK